MPGVEHACFISYKHPPEVPDGPRVFSHFWTEFIDAFQSRLQSYLTVNPNIYWDPQLHDVPGSPYPAELSRNLCRSACLVAILVPEYMESTWCRAEWNAMRGLAARRSSKGVRAHVIPVLFRGQAEVAEAFVGEPVIVDFRHIVSPARDLGMKRNRRTMEHIASQIDDAVRQLTDIEPCDSFMIPIDDQPPGADFDDPDPLL
jgi:hypothetical protein